MASLRPLADALADRRRRRRPRPDPARGVLLIASGGLGDTILLSHVLHRFQALARADETITVLLRKDGATTAFLFPPEIEVITVDYDRLRRDGGYRRETGDRLHAAHYRRVVSLDYLRHPRLDEYLIAAAQGSETLGMIAKPWAKYHRALDANRKLFDALFDSGSPVEDKILRWNRFADWLTGAQQPPPRALTPPARLPAPTPAAATPYAMVQAFSAVRAKQIQPAVFEALLRVLPTDWEVVFTGAPGEDLRNPDYAGLLSRPGVRYDDSTFEALVPALRAARVVISVDTALMHLAIAVGAPTLGLASAAYVGEIVPYAAETTPPNVRFVYHDLPCRSCLGDCRLPLENGRFACVDRLAPDVAVAALRDVLAKRKGPS